MMKKPVAEALNDQINAEFYSAYLYLSMAGALEDMGLRGFANWMRIQAREETGHGMKIFNHLIERGARVTLTAIKAPPTEWPDVLTIVKESLKHEQHVTGRINALVDLAIKESDHATNAFLQWFVDEQVEEEASLEEIVQQLNLAHDSKGALFILDKEMGTREFVPPASEQTG